MATTDDILIKWAAAGWRIRLGPVRGLWRTEVREKDDAEWGSLRPADAAGYATPLDAAVAADTFITSVVAARQVATTTEQLTAVERILTADRLVRRSQTDTDGNTVIKWRYKLADGSMAPGNWETPHDAAFAWIAAGAQ